MGFWWYGQPQIEHNHAIGFRDMFPATELQFEKTAVRLLCEEHAVAHARWRMSGQLVPGFHRATRRRGWSGGERRGVFTFVVSLIEDRRLAVVAHNTDILPGQQTHLAASSLRLMSQGSGCAGLSTALKF